LVIQKWKPYINNPTIQSWDSKKKASHIGHQNFWWLTIINNHSCHYMCIPLVKSPLELQFFNTKHTVSILNEKARNNKMQERGNECKSWRAVS
jgi:hypothetical protein